MLSQAPPPPEPSTETEGDGTTETTSLTEEQKREKRLEEGIGIPHLIIDTAAKDKTTEGTEIDGGKLPAVEEVGTI